MIRIRAGAETDYTDSTGNIWLADRGFEGGDIVTRADDMKIENTRDAWIYRTEHWGMNSFSLPLPNGKYFVKLHFAETWEGITAPGERVFSFNFEGREFKDFEISKQRAREHSTECQIAGRSQREGIFYAKKGAMAAEGRHGAQPVPNRK